MWLLRPKGQEDAATASAQDSDGQHSNMHGASANSISSPVARPIALSEPQTTAPKRITPEPSESSGAGFEAWKQKILRPIEFYGKVVDENEQPVEGASVSFSYNQFIPPERSFETNTVTDQNGLFSLSGVVGSTLGVHVEKAGYYSAKSVNQNHFDYMKHSGSAPFFPDSRYPVVFHLRKKGSGAELITSQHGMSPEIEISGLFDGSTVRVNFFNQTVGHEGQLELSSVKPRAGQQPTGWSFRMSIPDGGFVEQNDEFPFEAPESGYNPTLEFDFRAGTTNWTENLHKRYYIVFGQPPKYGRIDVETGIHRGVSLSYAINRDGSRNLEPK